MSRLARTMFAMALLALTASAALAVTYPPGPAYRFCPDSVTTYQVQMPDTLVNHCFPFLGDTVLGIRGIIVGFRQQSTGRIYLENSNAADYSGVQIYTQNTHYESLGYVVGDSISVLRGIMGVYQLENQIAGNYFIQIEKIESAASRAGRGLGPPPYRIGTTTTYNWTPVPASGIPSIGSLVKVIGPLKVVRRGPGAGLASTGNWLCVNNDGSAPTDSINIDGSYITTDAGKMIAPPLGTVIDWVQGVMRRSAGGGVDCLQISLRDANDISVQAPPNLGDAYPIADNKLRLQFDTNVDVTSAENEANYTLGSGLSGSTVDLAEVVGGSGTQVDLTITDVLGRLALETIQSENIGSETCPACLSPQQSREFILGVLTCAEVQAPLPDSLLAEPCQDRSRFAGVGSGYGPRITVRGVVSAKQAGALTFMEDAADGQRSGVAAYNIPFAHVVGNQYLLACVAQEYYGMTELNNPVAMFDEGAATPPGPSLTTIAVLNDRSCDVNQETTNAEDFEGVLVRIENAKIVGFNPPWTPPFEEAGSFRIAGPVPECPDTILIYSGADTHYPGFTPVVDMWVNVNGSFYFTDDRDPQLYPRSKDDIENLGQLSVPPGGSLQVSLSVKPNPGVSHRVSFVVPRKDKVELGVYDLLGRRVALLAKGEYAAGEYTRNWDGRGADGTRRMAGVYFYRLTVGKEVRTQRAVMLH